MRQHGSGAGPAFARADALSDNVLKSQNASKQLTILQFGATDSSGLQVVEPLVAFARTRVSACGQFEACFCVRPPEEYFYALEAPTNTSLHFAVEVRYGEPSASQL